MKKTTLDLYKELFTVANDHNDMFYAKHAKDFHAKYPDCPKPEAVECIEIEVPYDIAETWVDEDGEADTFRMELDDKMAELIIDRKVLDYIKKNVTEPELLANLSSCISPIRSIQSVVFHTEDCFWHCMVRIDEIDTSIECSSDFWFDAWEVSVPRETGETKGVNECPELYFAWSKVINSTYRDGDVEEDYKEHNAVLMRWNPAISNYTKAEFMADLQRFRNGQEVVYSWAVWDYNKVQIGDKVYFLCVGDNPRGIVATGTIIAKPYVAEDWSGKGRKVHYVDFKVDMMYNPDGYICNLDTLQLAMHEIEWNEGHSGIVIDNNALKDRLAVSYNSFYNDMYLHRPEQFRDRP